MSWRIAGSLLTVALLAACGDQLEAEGGHETDGHWSGYAAVGGPFHDVSARFSVPTITCPAEDADVAIWVGLDGYANGIVEQVGIDATCRQGTVRYSAWWEVYPRPIVDIDTEITAGDIIELGVTATAAGPSFELRDVTSGASFREVSTLTGQQYASAEVVVEQSDMMHPTLGRFDDITFLDATVDGAALGASGPRRIVMVDGEGAPRVDVGALDDGGRSFVVRWLGP